jgi:HPt (histidine-containing phosphotransfer) domain-containing protein
MNEDMPIHFKLDELRFFWETFNDTPLFARDDFLRLYHDTNAETVIKILARFHENLVASLDQVKVAMANGDDQSIFKASHKMAGTAGLLGFKDFGESARELSQNLQENGDLARWSHAIGTFVAMAENIKTQISKACPNLKDYL